MSARGRCRTRYSVQLTYLEATTSPTNARRNARPGRPDQSVSGTELSTHSWGRYASRGTSVVPHTKYNSALLSEVSKRDRVPHPLHSGNAVLPLLSRRPAQQVRRAWLGGQRDALPARVGRAA